MKFPGESNWCCLEHDGIQQLGIIPELSLFQHVDECTYWGEEERREEEVKHTFGLWEFCC